MAYVTIDPTSIEVGDALKKDLFDLIKANEDDLDSRISSLSIGSNKISLFNEDVFIGSNYGSLSRIATYEVIQSCIITEFSIQIFAKSPATTGSLTVDIKKNTTTNPAGFTSLLTVLPTLNLASVADYAKNTGTINTGVQALAVGDILKIEITSLPFGLQEFRLTAIGET